MSDLSTPIQELTSVVYVSSSVRVCQDQEIAEILATSKQNNERVGITGMLLYKKGNFMQLLEGPAKNIDELISKIRTDHRHRGFITLTRKKIACREFPTWSMAFQNIDKLRQDYEESLSTFMCNSLLDEYYRTHPDGCYRLLTHFKQNLR